MTVETTLSSCTPVPVERRASRLRYLYQIVAFAALVITLGWALNRYPRTIPSALIGKAMPQFSLPPVKGRSLGLASTDVTGEGSLVNVFASWCVACREEQPAFMQMKAESIVPIHGFNYKDQPDNAARWFTCRAPGSSARNKPNL